MTSAEPPTIVFGEHEEQLLRRLEVLQQRRERVILGICGFPGVGKSTLAEWLRAAVAPMASRIVPMDGFHLSNGALAAAGLADRKGAIETFDPDGYAALLERLRLREEDVVHAPGFDRVVDEPIAASIAVGREVPLVITEGNYLLCDGVAWQRARRQMDEVWFVDVDPALRRRRLVERHVRFGRTTEEARAWVDTVDEPNARLIGLRRDRAHLTVRLDRDLPAVG